MREEIRLADGSVVEGTRVPILRISPGYTEIELEDGSVIEVQAVPVDARRLDGKVDQEGNQVYSITHQVFLKVRSAKQVKLES
jgi:hypothetical protein